MNRRNLIAFAVAAASAVPALAAPGDALAANCFKALPGPDGTSWTIRHDGAQEIVTDYKGGSNFDQGHGRLHVGGIAYPSVNDESCGTTATSINFPQRSVNGITVSRQVKSIGGRLRRVDILINESDVQKSVDVDYAVRVQPSQVSINSSSGNAAVTSADHWSTHDNDGNSNPFMQWGDGDGPLQPIVTSLGDDPAVWQHKAGSMPDATLAYDDIAMPANSIIRLVHMNGTTASPAASKAAAEDGATPFSGMTRGQAMQVRNWGPDPDGDGVPVHKDECPDTNGNQADGCLAFAAEPADLGDGDPKPPAGDPQQPGSGPGQPGPDAGPGADTTAPVITLSKLGRSAKRSRLAGKGLRPRIVCNEACSIRVRVTTRKRGARKARTVLTTKATPSSTATRTVLLKLKSRKLRALAKQRVTVVITATDAAGNRSSIKRTVRLAR